MLEYFECIFGISKRDDKNIIKIAEKIVKKENFFNLLKI